MGSSRERSRFAQRFDRAYGQRSLPLVYRNFIVTDAYVPYRRAFIRGLSWYDPTEYVELGLADSTLLRREELLDDSDINPRDAVDFHPVAIVQESPQFLAIRTTARSAPVFLWHHETGAFHLQFPTFERFLKKLRTPAEARAEQNRVQAAFRDIRRKCVPALALARELLIAGELPAAAAALDGALHGRRPIAYDGTNDFDAIGILCDCFNLRGRIRLAQGRLKSARAAFLDAMGCGGTPYREAVVDAVVASFLLEDIEPVVDEICRTDPEHYEEPPGPILKRNFNEHQIERLVQVASSATLTNRERAAATHVLAWVSSIREGSERVDQRPEVIQ